MRSLPEDYQPLAGDIYILEVRAGRFTRFTVSTASGASATGAETFLALVVNVA